jgi:hypothetical protein
MWSPVEFSVASMGRCVERRDMNVIDDDKGVFIALCDRVMSLQPSWDSRVKKLRSYVNSKFIQTESLRKLHPTILF